MRLKALLFLSFTIGALGQWDPYTAPGQAAVHLFEWKWTDIAKECERFLAPSGYGAVQVGDVANNCRQRDFSN